jgi:hypothetical protein
MFRILRWVLTPLVILAVLFVGANIVVEHLAEGRIASAAQDAFHLSSKPSVDISGFPIITNVLSGHLPRISFSAPKATFEGLSVDTINVALVDVKADGGFLHGGPIKITVGAGTIRARATEASVNAYLKAHSQNATITFGSDRVVLHAVRLFLGRRRTFVATGTIAREGSSLVFRPTSVTIDGHAPPPGTATAARQKATVKVQLPELPGGITLYKVTAVEGAIAIAAVLSDQAINLSA